MKYLFVLFFFLLSQLNSFAQVKLPVYPDSLFSTYYHQRWTLFQQLPNTTGDIIFLGNSITDGGEWSELFNDVKIKNRGISGDVTTGLMHRIEEIIERRPAKVFMLIGVNDLARNIPADTVVKNITLLAAYLLQQSPSTQVFIQSVLPVNDYYGLFSGHTSKRKEILQVNQSLKEQAEIFHYAYVDLYSAFVNKDGKLRKELTNDGLHLKGEGYMLWKHLVYPYVYGLQQEVSLIPQPRKTTFTNAYFPLYKPGQITVKDDSLMHEAGLLQKELMKKGLNYSVSSGNSKNNLYNIELKIGTIDEGQRNDEAYQLEVDSNKVLIIASTSHGIFNGIQTLLQLARDGVMIDGCRINDWPAFAWRGYMIDVGRNYMSMDLLKQQIDVMASYKFNVFHFHPTEDIAWRIQSKLYPQLNAPETMLRNKGMYYTEGEIKELIQYCRDRHITFVPEIDMPGHSAAFRRAMKTDMQSDSGMVMVKNILREFCSTYDVPFIHIGADEVKITNNKFIPEMTALLEDLGKKVIGWEPGGNFSPGTIRQLWMDDNGRTTGGNKIRFIDSRHLYLNHMDPLETVVTIFNRKIGNKEQGDASMLGGTICMWHDRAVAKEEDVLKMNAVYPGMLAFAERSWNGGGVEGWVANVSDGNEKSFQQFELRLLDHKQQYFSTKPFPYVQQANLKWELYGPYRNYGEVSRKFEPETGSARELEPAKEVTGGTVVLRHWWAPLIKGALESPDDSTTWYAHSRIWSDRDTTGYFWIGFNNISRSPATDSPPVGAWDNKGSEVWVNGKKLKAPDWKRGGQQGNSEIPLIDEGYEFRDPTAIALKKGWNDVLIKAPIGSFRGKDWQNPVKWEFTFIRVN